MPIRYDDQRGTATKPRVAGNIDLHNRPRVQNPDGSFSTVRSMSIGTDDGEVLIPTISDDGRTLTEDEAVALYRKSGRHLGIFSTPDEATSYAQTLHDEQAREYAKPKGRIKYDDDQAPASSGGAPPGGISELARLGYGRGGRAPDEATRRAMLDNGLTRGVEAAIDDPVGTLQAIPAGFNKGVAMLAGLPMDTATSAGDLLGMAYGLARSKLSGRPADEFYEPADRRQVFGTGEYIASKLDQGTRALGVGPVTENPRPDNPAARLLYATASGVPGALTGRAALAGGAGGGTSQIVSEAGGSPGAQAIAGLVGGRVVENARAPTRPTPLRPTDEPQAGTFGRDSASAAAAVPELANVPRELQAPLTTAFQRGDRDLVARVVEAETLPIPVRLLEGQARQDPALISDELNYRGADSGIPERLKEQNQALIDNLDEIRRQVSPNVVAADHIQNGQGLIDAYKAYDAPQRERITAMYKALEDANGGQLPINAAGFVRAADAALAKKLKTRYLPAELAGDLNDLRESGGMMTFEQLENMRTNLAAASRKADAARDGNAAAAINEVRRALETAPLDVPPELKQLADQARSAARARFEALDADPAYRAAIDDDTPPGELSALADDFVKKFVVNGKAANLQRMQAALERDPVARETIAAAALNWIKSKSGVNLYTNEGNFSQAGFNRALQEIMPKLEALVPRETAELLAQLGNVARHVQARPKGSFVNESNTFTAAAAEAGKSYAEGTLNTVVPGAQLGTFIRKRRQDKRDKNRARRALDPAQYLTAEDSE